MKEVELIDVDYRNRLTQVLDESWKIFKSQFVNERNIINKEAPFQHHFAQIIRGVGDLYSICENDLFKIDLEVKIKNVKGKSKYIDIACEFRSRIKCAIELKFKTKNQGAQDVGRIDAYIDLEALEIVTNKEGGYDIGKFYMITNSPLYIKPFKGEHGSEFMTHDNHVVNGGQFCHSPKWKNARSIVVDLRNSYKFEWEKISKNGEDWYFLELTVEKT